MPVALPLVGMRFRDFAAEVENLKRATSKRTREVSRAPFRRLVDHFGANPIQEITEFSWNTYVLKCKAETPQRRLTHDRKIMTTIMLAAFRQGLIHRRVTLRIPDAPREVGREIQEDELVLLFKAASKELRLQLRIALLMGLRLREMLGLRWERFDWKAQAIRLLPEDTKTRRGRVVPIPSALFSRLQKRYYRISRKTPCVFPSRFNSQKPQYENKTAWQACKRRAGVECRWHDLRHTSASILLRAGITTGVVSRYLGMSEQVLTRIYRHINLDELREAAEAIGGRTPKMGAPPGVGAYSRQS